MARTKPGSSMLATAKPVLVLVSICMVAGVLLGAVYAATAPVAAAAAAERQQQTYRDLVPDAASFEELSVATEGCSAFVRAADEAGSAVGSIAVAQAKGYSGQVPLAVAFAPDGTVVRVVAMGNSETPGLGTRIAEEQFIGQFAGLPAQAVREGDIDTISGATISSKAAIEAFNRAVEAFGEVG